jgi:hypothetical protein
VIVFVLLFLSACSATTNEVNPYFIGEIQYRYSYTSDELNTDSLTQQRPAAAIFRYDTLHYQSKFIGKDTFIYFYSGILNKAVSKKNSSMEKGCEDYSQPTDSILSFSIYDTDVKVLGYPCRILEFRSKIFHTRYYVSTDLKIAPGTYQKHKAYNWSFYGRQTNGGLILKLEHRFKNYTMTGIATTLTTKDNPFSALEIEEKEMLQLCNN